jgi:hypothetical protein
LGRGRERERERDEIAQSVQSKCSIRNSRVIVLLQAAMPVAFLISSVASMKKYERGPEGNLIPVDNIKTVFSIFYPRILWFEI